MSDNQYNDSDVRKGAGKIALTLFYSKFQGYRYGRRWSKDYTDPRIYVELKTMVKAETLLKNQIRIGSQLNRMVDWGYTARTQSISERPTRPCLI
jgi:hypothetical protein